MTRMIFTLTVIAVSSLVFAKSGLVQIVPVIPLGFAIAASPKTTQNKFISVGLFSALMIAVGENGQMIVSLALLALVFSMLLRSGTTYTRSLSVGVIILVVEAAVGATGVSAELSIVLALRLFLAVLLTLSFLNIYGLQKE